MFGISKSFMESSLSMKYLDDIQKWLFLNTGAYKEGFWGAIRDAYNLIQVIGFALMAAFFLKALLTLLCTKLQKRKPNQSRNPKG